jgi:hypothetical protein
VVVRLAGCAPVGWTVADRRAWVFLWRLATLLLASLLLLLVCKFALDGVASLVDVRDPYQGMQRPITEAGPGTWVVGLGLLPVWPPAVFMLALAQAGGLALLLTPVFWLRQMARRPGRHGAGRGD